MEEHTNQWKGRHDMTTSHPIFDRAKMPVPADLDTIRGNQGVGPKRWQRAAANAERAPRTAGARLFIARLELAEAVAAWAPTTGTRDDWYQLYEQGWDPATRTSGMVFKQQFCGTLHAMIEASLHIVEYKPRNEGGGLEPLAERLKRVQEWASSTVSAALVHPAEVGRYRTGRCGVCGIKPPPA